MSDYQPPAATVIEWLRSNLGSAALAPLTGSDARALRASVQIIEQYAYGRQWALLKAWTIVVAQMLPHNRELAFHAIAHVLDWEDRHDVWRLSGMPADFVPKMKCSFEPGGSRIDYAELEAKEDAS